MIRCVDRPIVDGSCIPRIAPDSHQYESASTLRRSARLADAAATAPSARIGTIDIGHAVKVTLASSRSWRTSTPIAPADDRAVARLRARVWSASRSCSLSGPCSSWSPADSSSSWEVLYLALTWLIGLVGLAATRRWGAHRARKRAARADVVPVRPRGQPRFAGRLMPSTASPRCHSRSEVIEGTDRLRTCPVARRADGVPQLGAGRRLGPIQGFGWIADRPPERRADTRGH